MQPLDPVSMLYSTNSLLSPSIVNNTTQSALPPVSLTTNRQVEEQPTESLQTDLLTSSSPVVNTISSSLASVSLIQTNALPTPTPSTSSASQLCPSTSNTIPTSALNKHLKLLTLLQSKPTKTGSARVLTSAECLAMLEEKKPKKDRKGKKENKTENKRKKKRKNC